MNDLTMPPVALLASMLCATAALGAPVPGQGYVVDGRCVTVTAVDGDDVSYAWREGNSRGSGTLSADDLGPRCNPGTAPPPAAARPQAVTPSPAPQGNAAQRAPAGNAPAPGFAQEMLQAHNRLRCLHGAPPLQWRNDVAAYAQRWVEKAGYQHSDSYNTPLGKMGENLASGYASGADAVQDWYDESKGYDYQRVTQRVRSGHFVAMIWKDARYLGCTQVGKVVMCNYSAGDPPAECAVPNFNNDRCILQQVRPVSRSEQACQ